VTASLAQQGACAEADEKCICLASRISLNFGLKHAIGVSPLAESPQSFADIRD
jgi:hypothetical protein